MCLRLFHARVYVFAYWYRCWSIDIGTLVYGSGTGILVTAMTPQGKGPLPSGPKLFKVDYIGEDLYFGATPPP